MSYTVNDVMAELPLIADAIRSKEGTTEPIPFIDYKDRIAALKGEEVINYPLCDAPPVDGEPLVAWTVDSYAAGDTVLKNTGTLGADIQLVGDTPTLTTNNNVDVLQLTNTCAYITFPATNYATVFVVVRTPTPNSWDTATNFAVQVGGDTANHCVGLRENESGKTSVTYRNQAFTATAVAANDDLQVIAIRVGYMYKYVYANGWELTNGSSVSDSYQIQGLYLNSAGFKYAGAVGEAYTPSRAMQIREIYVFNGDYGSKIKDMTAWLLARVHQNNIFDEASEETPVAPVIPDDPYHIVETKPLFWFDASCIINATTLTNKGTSTDVINATGLAVDETEDAISLASETGAFYADFTETSEATVYVIYKPTVINRERGYDRCCIALRDVGDTQRSFRFYCEYMTENNVAKFVHKIGYSDSVHYSDDSDYITAASVSKSGYHRAYLESACVNVRDDIDDYNFSRIAANCVYAADAPLNDIPDNSYLIKAILVYNELHDSATVRKMTEWLNAKYRGL